ncbi:MAG: hypothetical protein OEW09_06445 [Anaerolineae bacterium]|nr:hypothetical protein [Anaerolineae bacterium]
MSSFLRNRRLLVTFAIAVLLTAGGAWYYYSQVLPAQAPPAEETIRTTRVRRGDLVIYASGTGTLIPSTEVDLGFSTGGVLAEALVEVGDRVGAGRAGSARRTGWFRVAGGDRRTGWFRVAG